MSKNLLALDQSSRITGFAVFKDGMLIKVGKFTLEDVDFGVRLDKFAHKITQLIRDYEINELAFEEIQLQQNVDTFKKLAMVYGVTMYIAEHLHIPYEIISSNTWKSKCGIKKTTREPEKKQAQQFVQEKYGIKVTQDEADATCLGWTHVSTTPDFDWSN